VHSQEELILDKGKKKQVFDKKVPHKSNI
jgi:hypothetical protein